MKLGKLNLLVPISMILCAAPGGAQKKDKAAEPSPLQTVSAKLPSLAVLPETLQVQDKGGVKITVGPVQYTLKEETLTTNRAAQPGFKEGLLAPAPRQNYIFVERTYTPRIVVLPHELRFQIHISNQLPRVFHGNGIAVLFNVAGKNQAIDPHGYASLVQLIVPPRGEEEVEIVGPDLATLPDHTTVGLFLYDVVTNTDAAGNTTEKQNFEWYFSYRVQLTDKELAAPSTQRLWVARR